MSGSGIHPTAVFMDGARIGAGVEIGPYVVLGPRVVLGDGCRVLSHAVVDGNTTVGANTHIHPHAVVGGEPQDRKYRGGDTRLVIGSGNQIREGVTIHTGTEEGGGATVLGDDNLLMANAHVAHDCILGDHVTLANNVMLAGHVQVEDGAILNGGVGIHHFTTIGTYAYVGGLSRITQDVPPYMIVEGHPSRVRSVNVIGLKRAGVDDSVVRAVKAAFKALYRSDRPMTEALEVLRKEYGGVAEVMRLVRFLEAGEGGRLGRQGEEKGRGLVESESKSEAPASDASAQSGT